jgi:hypothetical protein
MAKIRIRDEHPGSATRSSAENGFCYYFVPQNFQPQKSVLPHAFFLWEPGVSGKKKLTARKKLLDSEEEKAEEGEGGEGEGEQREMETDTVPVAGPSGLTRSQVPSIYFISVPLIINIPAARATSQLYRSYLRIYII